YPDVPRQRARHRDHLLFATGEEIRRRVESRGELRKEMQDLVVGPGYAVALAALEAPELEVVAHAHAGKQAPSLRNVADAAARDFRRRAASEISAAERDTPVGSAHDADDGLQQRRLTGAVAAEQGDDLLLVHGAARRFDDVALAVERVDPRELEQERRALAGGTPSRSCGKRGRAGADIDLAHSGALAGFPNGAVDQHAAFVH